MNQTTMDFDRVRAFTVVDDERLASLVRLVQDVDARRVPGDLVECGVARGGSAAVMAASTTRHIWLYDSCQGLPEPKAIDGMNVGGISAGDYVGANYATPAIIGKAMAKVGVSPDRYTLRPGWFEDTFLWPGPSLISLLHIDADWYDSVILCLRQWYDYVTPGGYIVLDDYGFWPGCAQAFMDFIAERNLKPDLYRVGKEAAYWIKNG